jgi:hypothetical protein
MQITQEGEREILSVTPMSRIVKDEQQHQKEPHKRKDEET